MRVSKCIPLTLRTLWIHLPDICPHKSATCNTIQHRLLYMSRAFSLSLTYQRPSSASVPLIAVFSLHREMGFKQQAKRNSREIYQLSPYICLWLSVSQGHPGALCFLSLRLSSDCTMRINYSAAVSGFPAQSQSQMELCANGLLLYLAPLFEDEAHGESG